MLIQHQPEQRGGNFWELSYFALLKPAVHAKCWIPTANFQIYGNDVPNKDINLK